MKSRDDHRCLAALLAVLLVPAAAAADVPLLMTHHGMLSQGGNPVQGSTLLTFRLYDSEAAPAPFWEESVTVTVEAGYYSALLGQTVALDPADLVVASQPWLGIVVAAGAELSPRLRVSSVPYAMLSAQASSALDLTCTACVSAPEVAFAYAASSSTGGPALDLACSEACIETAELTNGLVNTAKLADNAVTTPKLDAAAVTADKVAANAIASANIIDNTIAGADINSATTITVAQVNAAHVATGPSHYVLVNTDTCLPGDTRVALKTVARSCSGDSPYCSYSGISCTTAEHDWSTSNLSRETCTYRQESHSCDSYGCWCTGYTNQTCLATGYVLCNP